MGSSAPPPPDYAKAAERTAGSSQQAIDTQTRANRVNTVNAWGSNTWSQDPTTGQWTQTQSLDPRQQQALDSQFGIQGGRLGLANNLFGRVASDIDGANPWETNKEWDPATGSFKETSRITAWGAAPQASDDARQRAEDAIYKRATSRLDPQWQRDEESKRAQLYSMGLKEGDAAYDAEMQKFQNAKTDAYNQAAYSSIGAGQDAYDKSFSQSLQGAGFANSQRAQQISEALQKSGWSLNQINALMAGMGVTGAPAGQQVGATAGAASGTDYFDAAKQQYADQLKYEDSKNSFWNNLAKGAVAVGGAVAAPFTGGASVAGAAALEGALR